MESPQSFAAGVGMGTGSLLMNVGSGVVSSGMTIVSSATGSVSSVAKTVVSATGEGNYVRKREEKNREIKASKGGVLAGFKAGGESVVSGFTSGISGLVTRPYEEAKKGGTLGFIKGVGQGIVGVAVKPIMGITDGIGSVATGLSNQVENTTSTTPTLGHIRPARAFALNLPFESELILVKINLLAAEAQRFVLSRGRRRDYQDFFLDVIHLGFNSQSGLDDKHPFAIILSDRFVFLVNKFFKEIWVRPFGDFSHFVLHHPVGAPTLPSADSRATPVYGIDFVLYRSGGVSGVGVGNSAFAAGVSASATGGAGGGQSASSYVPNTVVCANKRALAGAFQGLSRYRYRFGMPSEIISDEAALAILSGDESIALAAESYLSNPRGDPSISTVALALGAQSGKRTDGVQTEGYSFGTANILRFNYENLSDKNIIKLARERFSRITFTSSEANTNINSSNNSKSNTSEKDSDVQQQIAYFRDLDRYLWRFISEWNMNHSTLLNQRRCLAALVLNYSHNGIKLNGEELIEGLKVVILPVGQSYDESSRFLHAGGGAAVVFAYGRTPSLVSKEHVKLRIITTGFEATLSTRDNRSNVVANGGYVTKFLEKARTEFWSKFVIHVE